MKGGKVREATTPVAQQIKLSVGNIIFSLLSDSNRCLTVAPAAKSFLVSEGEPDITLRAEFGAVPSIPLEEEVFDTGESWSLYRSNGRLVFDFLSRELESTPHKIAVIDPDFNAGIIYTRIGETGQEGYFNPLNYPLDELLVISRLSRGEGILVHACGVDYQGQGLLFLGTSGAGKSTLANLWKGEPEVKLLSDDRIIIRDMGSSYRIYGTPWHGNADIASPLSTPISSIFFLAHGYENRLTRVQPTYAASRLLVCSFPTFWDAKGMEYTLELCARLSTCVPCFELGLVPDKGVLDILR